MTDNRAAKGELNFSYRTRRRKWWRWWWDD